jgi:hypothetical protein
MRLGVRPPHRPVAFARSGFGDVACFGAYDPGIQSGATDRASPSPDPQLFLLSAARSEPRRVEAMEDLLSSLVPFFGCVFARTADGLELTGASRNFMNAAAVTTRTFRAPFTLRAVAKTDSTNVRLYWHLGEIIFNWECSIRQLRVHDPATGKQRGIDDRGFVTPGEWHEFVWTVARDSMRVTVDGQLRVEAAGDYSAVDAPLAIGPCFGSTVTVRELTLLPS